MTNVPKHVEKWIKNFIMRKHGHEAMLRKASKAIVYTHKIAMMSQRNKISRYTQN